MALLPLAVLLLAWLSPQLYAATPELSGWAWWAVGLVSIGLSVLDQQKLKAAGFDVANVAIFMIPAYLFLRAKVTGSSVASPVAWCAAILFSFLAVSTFAAVYSYSSADVANDIQHQLQQQSGGSGITVSCPKLAGHAGASFSCVAGDRQGETAVVTVTLSSSGYAWRLG